VQIENLEPPEAADAVCQDWDVSALETLLGKLEDAQVAAEFEHVQESQQMHVFQLVRMHPQDPQVRERELLEVTEADLDGT
jgi:hypothetical protein